MKLRDRIKKDIGLKAPFLVAELGAIGLGVLAVLFGQMGHGGPVFLCVVGLPIVLGLAAFVSILFDA